MLMYYDYDHDVGKRRYDAMLQPGICSLFVKYKPINQYE